VPPSPQILASMSKLRVKRNTESIGDFCSQNFTGAMLVALHEGAVWSFDFISSNTLSVHYINITISDVLRRVILY